MMNRNYIANELVTFAKYRDELSNCGEYLIVGFYNKDKKKIKDLKTGEVYPLTSIVIHPMNPYWSEAVVVNGQTFVKTKMTPIYANWESITRGYRYIRFSETCIFTKKVEPFREPRYNQSKYQNLIKFANAQRTTERGIVSIEEILGAIEEANSYARNYLVNGQVVLNDPEVIVEVKDGSSLTEEERDF